MKRISRTYLPILGLAAALLAPGCGGDSGSSNTSNQNSSQTGSGGSTSSSSSGPSSCTPTRCKNDVEYTAYSQMFCDLTDMGPCGAQDKARVKCSLANETCTADGVQDRSSVEAACKAELDAFDKCNAALAGSGS